MSRRKNKNIIKETLQLYKRKFYYFLSVDIVFFLLLFFFLIYARNKIQSYITLIQQYTPDLAALQNKLQQSTDINTLLQLENLLNSINEIIRNAFIFGYFIFPLVLFLLWTFFQGLNYKLIKEDKLKHLLDLKYFIKFAIFTLPFFIILILLFIKYLNLFDRFIGYYGGIETPTFSIYLLLIIPLVMFYILTIFYSLIDKRKIKELLTAMYNAIVKKSYITVPLFLPFLITWILLLVFFTNLYVIYLAGFFSFSTFSLIILVLLLMLFISIYRVFFATFLERL